MQELLLRILNPIKKISSANGKKGFVFEEKSTTKNKAES